jgi:succinoglycan biosynthesis transport protein ExoP
MRLNREEQSVINLSEFVAILRRRWWLLVLVPLLAAASAFWFTARQAPSFTASATLLVNPVTTASSEFVSPGAEFSSALAAANLLTKTYSRLVTSPAILERVIASLELTETADRLASRVKARNEPDTQIILISTDHRDPQLAVSITNAIVDTFVAWVAELQTARSTQSSQALQDSIDEARADMERASTELAALRAAPRTSTPEETERIASLEALRQHHQTIYSRLVELQQRVEVAQLSAQHRISIIARADLPQQAGGVPARLYVALAAFLGLGAAATGTVLFEQLNRRVRSSEDVRRAIELPVLTSIRRAARDTTIEGAPRDEAIRTLRTRLQFATNGREMGTIAITSPGLNDGRSAVAANLAVALAQAGQQVVLIDGNLAQPCQNELFGLPSRPGLANLLAGPAERLDGLLLNGPVSGLQLLPAGTNPDSPSEVLTSERLERIIGQIRKVSDVVVIDTPPLLTHSDALLLAAAADHAVLVAEAGQTRPKTLEVAVASLRSTTVNLLGVVLHGGDRGVFAS